MARPLRVRYPGAVYHVWSRGNAGERIFRTDTDRRIFLALLTRVVDRRRWRCYAYCLMTTHFHLVLETPRANVSEGMQYLNGVYAQGFNKHYGRFGHVLHGRFSAVLIESERQFFETVRYVVLNPVRAGICERAEDWPWSSHRATAGLAPIPPFLTVDRLVSRLAPDPADGIHAYRAFIAEATPSTAGAREGGTDS